ncbi:MAG: alkaline phosphatase family protein [Gemmataceae bacterium]|nr:alkaline phosphatase family protein [Gemmataceae bacterium]
MNRSNGSAPRKVLLAEFNEITWRLVDPLCAQGKLPTFAEFVREGARGTPVADEVPPYLDPWISWTTAYTGRPREEHGVRFLEQPPNTVTGPRVWDVAADAGKRLGIFGSIMSWPPRTDIDGFWVPSTFSPSPETFPAELQPIQELNLGHTRAHSPVAGRARVLPGIRRAWQLLRLGLRPSTAARVARFFAGARLGLCSAWEKVSLQPLVNLDFFEPLYRKYQPDLATFHTNHVAHYQHRYWRAMDPAPFPTQPSPEEQRRYGPAVEYGYRTADEALRRLWRLADANTVLILASGLGQQPYVNDEFPEGRAILRLRDVRPVIELCGLTGHCTPLSMMAPQWNLRIADPERRKHAERVLGSAWVGTPGTQLFAFVTAGDTINFNVRQTSMRKPDLDALCSFPDAGGRTMKLGELCAADDATPKEGCHDRPGVIVLRGPGIRRGVQMNDCTNLDLAPTILHLLGLPVPAHMHGRVLFEALEDGAREDQRSLSAGLMA